MNMKVHLIIGLLSAVSLASCSSSGKNAYQVEGSYLQSKTQLKKVDALVEQEDKGDVDSSGFRKLTTSSFTGGNPTGSLDISASFSDVELVEITSDELPMDKFLHYVFGELLRINYILGQNAKDSTKKLTLNLQEPVSKRELYLIARDLLLENGFVLKISNGITFIAGEEESAGSLDVTFGYGRTAASVPQSTSDILQYIPLNYGYKTNINFVLPKLARLEVTPEPERDAVLIKGKRSEVLKGLDFILMLDKPAYQGRFIAIFEPRFLSVNEVDKQLKLLLKEDGYEGGLTTVLLPAQSSIILFSNQDEVLGRAEFWLTQLDQPMNTDDRQYFVYEPKYARAADLTESIAPLLGSVTTSVRSNSDNDNDSFNSNDSSTSRNRQRSGIKSAGNDKISVVVDERSNSLIVNASGKDYRNLLPLIERLDTAPKQVMLEVVIAEVTLTDEFTQGVEFFLENNGYNLGTKGALGLDKLSGLTYALTGSSSWEVSAKLQQRNSLVNIVSRPSIVVRDGMSAKMQVGTDIPIESSISTPGSDLITTSVQYRKTGLTLSVTPTVNSQGIVIMEIDQEISNVLTTDGGGAPSIFERAMQTEVVANSGQTVILGGLISENNTDSDNKVPGFGDLPILGNLFKSKSDKKEKTELVIMVTPKIVESDTQWQDIKSALQGKLNQVILSN